jgi:putative colanic acid biosynthesis acetyltransferase WcaF
MKLSNYDNTTYKLKLSLWKQAAWYFFGGPLLKSYWMPFSTVKVCVLRLFGATIGHNVTIKPGLKVKYPWNLVIEDDVWIGEDTWIDNLALVTIENNCCISQDVYFCTGNHNWSKSTFDLITGEIYVENSSWIAAKSVIGPGVVVGQGVVLCLGSVANKSLNPMTIYSGNPAEPRKDRKIV